MKSQQDINKELVIQAFDTLFNKRDYAGAERFWSPTYIQHSAHISPGREGLFGLIKSLPATLKYEHGLIVAEGALLGDGLDLFGDFWRKGYAAADLSCACSLCRGHVYTNIHQSGAFGLAEVLSVPAGLPGCNSSKYALSAMQGLGLYARSLAPPDERLRSG